MEPEMNEHDTRKGNLIVGAMLVAVGAAIMADRANLMEWSGRWTLWPLILGGIGAARFIGTPAGSPKQGLLFLTAAAWLFLGEAGWISLADSWPMAVIVLGLIIALNGGTRRRWAPPQLSQPPDPAHPGRHRLPHEHPRTLGGLAVIGIWIAVVVALRVSGAPGGTVSTFTDPSSPNRVHVVSVFGRAEHTSRGTPFEGAQVMNMFGRSEIDLREATLKPGERQQLQIMSAFGAVEVRIPPTWTVDTGAISALGGVADERPRLREGDAPAGPAPRLDLRGLVMFGRLTIRS
jgi:hypothetical protein